MHRTALCVLSVFLATSASAAGGGKQSKQVDLVKEVQETYRSAAEQAIFQRGVSLSVNPSIIGGDLRLVELSSRNEITVGKTEYVVRTNGKVDRNYDWGLTTSRPVAKRVNVSIKRSVGSWLRMHPKWTNRKK